jgi:hypothetical protein
MLAIRTPLRSWVTGAVVLLLLVSATSFAEQHVGEEHELEGLGVIVLAAAVLYGWGAVGVLALASTPFRRQKPVVQRAVNVIVVTLLAAATIAGVWFAVANVGDL